MKVRYLLDEHLPKSLVEAVQKYDPGFDIVRIGATGAPPLGTLDPDLLIFCEAMQRVLVTDNRKSMPVHILAHFAAGRTHWGVFEVDRTMSIGEMAYQLQLFWGASEAEAWKDQTIYLPF